MIFQVTRFDKNVHLSLEAENDAEQHQLKWLRDKLYDEGAHCGDWRDMDDHHGITVVVELMEPNVEFSGDAPLHGAASAGTQG